ncbi:MAG: BamA/TamA family outer membrane protein [Chitinophagaceae bacterium]|nr:BamA/TamA family outer membrane protein [Chitinophagaceae bacterium]
MFQAQYLGSDDNLRGYRKERFAGKSKFYNQTELRLKLANLKTYLFPAAIGVFAFFDAGRVWQENDSDKKMLTGYGGGLWFSPLRRFVIAVSYAISKEDKIPLVSMGFKF